MLNVHLDETNGIALLEPEGKLSENDFTAAAAAVDPLIERTGKLNGIIIHVKHFPGWDSFAALVNHMRFVKDHHKKVARVAFATDSPVGEFAEHVARHFVNAEIKRFAYDQLEGAKAWVTDGAAT